MANRLPDTIFYSETGGKSAPFYRTLAGIKSAFKTTWGARYGWDYRSDKRPPPVYRGEVTWQEVDLETGLPLYRTPDVAVSQHCRVFHEGLVLGHDPIETHRLAHNPMWAQDHTHGDFSS